MYSIEILEIVRIMFVSYNGPYYVILVINDLFVLIIVHEIKKCVMSFYEIAYVKYRYFLLY